MEGKRGGIPLTTPRVFSLKIGVEPSKIVLSPAWCSKLRLITGVKGWPLTARNFVGLDLMLLSIRLYKVIYTADFKLNAIEKANEVGNREAARFFNVDESNIRLWRRNKTNFENCDRRKRADRRGKSHWPELEAEINKGILKERDDGKAVSTVSIRMKARVIAREMNIVNFSGGPTWCYRFMKGNNLVVQRSDRNYLMTGKNNLTTF
ncbi:pogo transposable element with KRAB [Trichonephila clavipes]|nr:pogo transposable element with KRAB [Trichonephila clavipes]